MNETERIILKMATTIIERVTNTSDEITFDDVQLVSELYCATNEFLHAEEQNPPQTEGDTE